MSEDSAPWLSVIMPAHSGASWIAATLDSLVAEADAGVEIIIIDSSPTPDTLDIARQYVCRLSLRIVERSDLISWVEKTNLGVEVARGSHVTMLHQDDLWLPGRLSAMRRWTSGKPEAALHLAPSAIVDAVGRRLGLWRCPLPAHGNTVDGDLLIERLLVQNFIAINAPVIRRDAWLNCGGLDPTLWYTADWDLWLKLAAIGPTCSHGEITTGFRVHGGSLTVSGSRNGADFRQQMQIVLDRHVRRLPNDRAARVIRAAEASITVNGALAAAAAGEARALLRGLCALLKLSPLGILRYFRDSRIVERVLPRLKARLAGTL
jgi:hypothetical protein